VWAVAACIVDKDGGPAAAVSIVVPMIRVRDDLIPYWSELTIDAANNISSQSNASRGRILGVRREVVDYRDPLFIMDQSISELLWGNTLSSDIRRGT
jgi:hypothetical protein